MMCHTMGLPPIGSIGFGRTSLASRILVPCPPQRMIAFMDSFSYWNNAHQSNCDLSFVGSAPFGRHTEKGTGHFSAPRAGRLGGPLRDASKPLDASGQE